MKQLTSLPSKSSEMKTHFTYKRMFFVLGLIKYSLLRGSIRGTYNTLLNSTSPYAVCKIDLKIQANMYFSCHNNKTIQYLSCEMSASNRIQEINERFLLNSQYSSFWTSFGLCICRRTRKRFITWYSKINC